MAGELQAVSKDLDTLLGPQREYSAVLKPILEAVRQAAQIAEVLPPSREQDGLELLKNFGPAVVAKVSAGDIQELHALCDRFVTSFRKLAGN